MPELSVLFFAGGLATFWAINGGVNWLNCRLDARSRTNAAAVVKRHGLSALLYLPSAGVDNDELRDALASHAFAGFIIVDDRDGRIVGKVAGHPPREPYLRLVISND